MCCFFDGAMKLTLATRPICCLSWLPRSVGWGDLFGCSCLIVLIHLGWIGQVICWWISLVALVACVIMCNHCMTVLYCLSSPLVISVARFTNRYCMRFHLELWMSWVGDTDSDWICGAGCLRLLSECSGCPDHPTFECHPQHLEVVSC